MKKIIKPFDQLSLQTFYEIIQLRIAVFIVEQECAFQEVDEKDGEAWHLYFQEGKTITAYLRILPPHLQDDHIPSIGRVCVNKDFRGKGLATQLMEEALHFIDNELKITQINVEAQEYLRSFYQTLGFKVMSDMFLLDDIPHIAMSRKITP